MSAETNKDFVLNEDTRQWLVVLFCALLFIGLVSARAAASIGMFGLIGTGLLFDNPISVLKKYTQRKELWVLSLFFFIVLVSGLWSNDKQNWLNWVRIKLPYLFLPIAFAGIRKLQLQKFTVILYAFVLTMFISTLVILVKYTLHYDTITNSFLQGSAMPIPYSHIRYTLMLAFSFFCCIYLANRGLVLFSKHEKWVQLFIAWFVFAALHILSVRSGLVALYLGLLYVLGVVIVKQKRWAWGLLLIAFVACIPFMAYKFVPSFHNKISYMEYDLERYSKGDIADKSDAMRLVSMKLGLKVWEQNKWLGAGAGDLKDEMSKVYDTYYPQVDVQKRIMPHNQFIWVLATTGLIGLALFTLAFFVPFITHHIYRYWPVAVLYIVVFSSFFTEDTLEEQIGTGFYLIFLLLFINHCGQNE